MFRNSILIGSCHFGLVLLLNLPVTTHAQRLDKTVSGQAGAQGAIQERGSGLDYFNNMKKIDVHTHIAEHTDYMKAFMDEYTFKCASILRVPRGEDSMKPSEMLWNQHPRYYAWITQLNTKGVFEPGWAEREIALLKQDFENGAIGVKVWKEIGMILKNEKGEYIQLDDPVFEPVFKFIASQKKTMIGHIGEPIDAWMPTGFFPDGVPRNYWAANPHFSYYNRPDLPSYTEIIAGLDRFLEKYPNLRYVGAHLASLEYNVEDIAFRLDKYSNFAVEIGGRMKYLKWQARGKVRHFFIKYSDRIMYGTDRGARSNMSPEQYEKSQNAVYDRYAAFSRYLSTADDIPAGNVIRDDRPIPEATYTVKGLNLPKDTLKDIMYNTPIKWFPGIGKDF